ncbi:hypothetical protein MKW94_006863 [Papaver nudicaule]|uniref:Uncharacterized protein n=1 Tax=Papaver nudicaule TaxID=74823 RepID=A0AA41VY91_PAPNU|nr:hypothetical protein [Papaver nudicaule]
MSWTDFLIQLVAVCVLIVYNSWSTLGKIQLGFFLCAFVLNLCISLIINPKKYEAFDERLELEGEVWEIRRNDRDGWSKKLVEKKKQEIAALEKKYGMLETLYGVSYHLFMLLLLGTCFINVLVQSNKLYSQMYVDL